MKIWYLIYSYNRIYDAMIQMEIVRNIYEKEFWKIFILHAYNWEKSWYKNKYLEDKLIRIKNPWHYEWASNLIDIWFKHFKNLDLDYIIVSASDTWFLNTDFIRDTLLEMKNNNKVLFTCPWWTPTRNDFTDVWMATDFFILDLNWEKKFNMFPVNYKSFYNKNIDLLRYLWKWNISYEKLLFSRFINSCFLEIKSEILLKSQVKNKLLNFSERIPIHSNEDWERTMEWKGIGFFTNHNIYEKQNVFENLNLGTWKYSNMLKNGQIKTNL